MSLAHRQIIEICRFLGAYLARTIFVIRMKRIRKQQIKLVRRNWNVDEEKATAVVDLLLYRDLAHRFVRQTKPTKKEET